MYACVMYCIIVLLYYCIIVLLYYCIIVLSYYCIIVFGCTIYGRSRSCVDRTSRDSLSTDSGSILGMDAKRGDESFE